MSNRITNTDGSRVGYWVWDLSDNETSGIVVLSVIPAADSFLKASPEDDDVEIQARENGTADPWTDIGATPLDLSGYTPETPVDFDFRLVAGSPLVDVRRIAIFVAVESAGAAGWAA